MRVAGIGEAYEPPRPKDFLDGVETAMKAAKTREWLIALSLWLDSISEHIVKWM